MPKLLTLSKCFTSLAAFLTYCVLQMEAYSYVMIDNCKLLKVFQGKFKRTNQNFSAS